MKTYTHPKHFKGKFDIGWKFEREIGLGERTINQSHNVNICKQKDNIFAFLMLSKICQWLNIKMAGNVYEVILSSLA